MLSGRGLYVRLTRVQKIPTECGVSECDFEASIMSWSWNTMGYCEMKNGSYEIKVQPIKKVRRKIFL